MSNVWNYLWLILLAIYIISPLDAHPLFLDDLIAAGILFYFLYQNSAKKRRYQQYYSNSSGKYRNTESTATGQLTLDRAYKLLGVSPNSSWDEIQKAYKEKMSKSHPDKVHHLSEELQQKAKELTLEISEAYSLIKRYKGQS